MILTDRLKEHIDNMKYEDMLSVWRFAESGHPMLQGEVGEYFKTVLAKKRIEVGDEAHVAASKSIGWR